jgi:phenylalanyl-tRNA synthetase beta subunit
VPAYAGIQITRTKVKQILEAIGSKVVSDSKDIISIEVPENRYDLKSETELIEEVIRKNGFYEIPHNEPIYLRNVKNITPRYIKVVEELREILPSMGYDEVLNWPLVDNKSNQSAKNNTQAILVENSVNEGVPELRKTISASLINNLSIYNKRDVRDINIFEIGPIWEMKREKYNENIGLGLLSSESSYINSLEDFRLNIEKILSKIGIQNYEYRSISKDIPKLANKHSYYRILKNSEELGTLCKIKGIGKTYLCELNINLLADLSSNSSSDVIVKKEKIQWIDKNVEKSGEHADLEVLNDINTNQEDLFVSIVDKYPLDKKTRYTIRTGN